MIDIRKKPVTYDLKYWLHGRHVETLVFNQSRALCAFLMKKAKESGNYKYGLLQISKNS